ncbi:hypothetical protein Nepgr_000984 [Nepenthes gracilis]|uniref:PGG domain-containing protein n=1 Tax=Nepenthes gracilis TaxID=150966 RepID=A0AAD3P291_NEPGR|nr:hypothetical protein Nepgr_000984 [Nepenthes gracilis]
MNAKDGDGNGILHLAVADKELEAIKIILSNNKINKNAQNANGFTALDIFAESSKDANKDREIKNVLQRTKFLRAVDIGDPNTWQKQTEWLETHRGALMVVASLIATMAFQAGLSPPGGVWQDATHENGTSVLAHTRPIYYNVYVLTTTIALASSMSIIILLVSGLPCKRASVGFIMMLMWIALMATMNTYLISMHALTPKDGYTMAIPVIRILSWVWSSLVGLLLLGHILRYFVGIIKMAAQLVQGVSKGFSSRSMDPPGA